jgi:hypothetical protein
MEVFFAPFQFSSVKSLIYCTVFEDEVDKRTPRVIQFEKKERYVKQYCLEIWHGKKVVK